MKLVYIKSENYIKQLKDKIKGATSPLPYTLTIYNHYAKTILYNILKWYSLTMLEPY